MKEREEQRTQQKEEEKGVVALIEQYENQRRETEVQNAEMRAALEEQQRAREEEGKAREELGKELELQRECVGILQREKEGLTQQVEKWRKANEGLEEEMRELRRRGEMEQRVDQYESEKFLGVEADLPTIPTLTDKQEKDLLLREYLHL